jgi:hypothetical protein
VKAKKQLKNDLFIVKANCKLKRLKKERFNTFYSRKRLAALMKDTEKKLEIHREVIGKIQQQITANK